MSSGARQKVAPQKGSAKLNQANVDIAKSKLLDSKGTEAEVKHIVDELAELKKMDDALGETAVVLNADLPPLQGEKSYKLPSPWAFAFVQFSCTFFSQFGVQWYNYFGENSKDSDGNWNPPWWVWGLFGLHSSFALFAFFCPLFCMPATLKRTKEGWKWLNIKGKQVRFQPNDTIESFSTGRASCCGCEFQYISMNLNDAYVKEHKSKSRCCRPNKQNRIGFVNQEEALQDLGLKDKATPQSYDQTEDRC